MGTFLLSSGRKSGILSGEPQQQQMVLGKQFVQANTQRARLRPWWQRVRPDEHLYVCFCVFSSTNCLEFLYHAEEETER